MISTQHRLSFLRVCVWVVADIQTHGAIPCIPLLGASHLVVLRRNAGHDVCNCRAGNTAAHQRRSEVLSVPVPVGAAMVLASPGGRAQDDALARVRRVVGALAFLAVVVADVVCCVAGVVAGRGGKVLANGH